MKVQVELTNRCNLNCDYCNYWNVKPVDLPLQKFKEIVESFDADRFILYGFGESTIHRDFNEILRIATSKAEVLLVTNGLNVSRFADKIDILAISVNRLNGSMKSMLKSLKGDRLYISVILTKENISEFPDTVRWCCENDINVIATNLIPYSVEMYEKTLFVEISKRPFEICRSIIEDVGKFFKEVARLSPEALKLYKDILNALDGYDLNLSYISKNWSRILLAERAESVLIDAKEIADSYGIKLDLPRMFADAKDRRCPYEDCVFVRADGKLAPCMELAYTHPLYLEFERKIEEYTTHNIDDVFFKKKRNLDEFPWCGDCQFADGCWYIEESMDCYGNKPSCSQCLYSVGIARCLL